MNEQQFFNEAYTHIMQQGEPSVSTIEGNYGCRYLTEDGLMCAFSVALVDDKARRMCEGNNAIALLRYPARREDYVKPEYWDIDRTLASSVQRAHDQSVLLSASTPTHDKFINIFHENMVRIAEQFNLDIPTIKKEQE